MRQFVRELAPLVRRHPAIIFAAAFCPVFIIANAVLAMIGVPKSPADISVILMRVLVSCALVELGLAYYRRLTRAESSEQQQEAPSKQGRT